MNAKIAIGRLALALSLFNSLSFAAGVGPGGIPPKEKEEANDENQPNRTPPFSIVIPEEGLRIPGFVHFINLVERGRVEEVESLLEEDPNLARRYVRTLIFFVTPDFVNPQGIGHDPRGPALTLAALLGDEAMTQLLARPRESLEDEALYTAVHANLLESVRAILEIALRNPHLRTDLLGDAGYPALRRNAFEYAVALDRPQIVAFMLDFARAHPEFAEWFFPERSRSWRAAISRFFGWQPAVDREYAQRMARNLFVAATQFHYAVVGVLLRSSLADRFYVDAERIAQAHWREDPPGENGYGILSPDRIDLIAKSFVMGRLIMEHRSDYAEIAQVHRMLLLLTYAVEDAFLNRDTQLLGRLLESNHCPCSEIIQRTLTLLLEKLYSDDALRKMFEPFTDFLNQMLQLQEQTSWQNRWSRQKLENLIRMLANWIDDSRLSVMRALGHGAAAVLVTLTLRESGRPWKRQR